MFPRLIIAVWNNDMRSLLYMPASNERAVKKAESLDVDALILDLEDATAFENKHLAREVLLKKLPSKPYGSKFIVIRLNDVQSEFYTDDLNCAAQCKPDAILIPKINNAGDVAQILQQMDSSNFAKHTQLWVMIETPQALKNIDNICGLAKNSRLTGLVLGINDLSKDMQIPLPTLNYPDRLGFISFLSNCILAARIHNLLIFDGVFNNFNDEHGLEYETQQAKQLGFDGKTIIHPKQIATVNHIFCPTAEEIEFAKKVINAFSDPKNQGKAALNVDGKMVELLHLGMANKLIIQADLYGFG